MIRLMDILKEVLSPTERTRRYNAKHPAKVRAHLRKTTADRVERNRARREAVKKHGKSKMAHHDVHHIGRTLDGKTRLAPLDHGPDKKH